MSLAALLLAIPTALAVAIAWQHFRYLWWRRTRARDQQPILHARSVLHVISYLRLAQGDDLVESLTKAREALGTAGGARWIYAGKVLLTGLESRQVRSDWDAIVLVQYDSREAYEDVVGSSAHSQAFAHFDATYHHGMRRDPVLNLLLPMFLLGLRVVDALRRVPIIDPYDRASEEDLAARGVGEAINSPEVAAARAYNEDAVVVFNLVLPGGASEQKANTAYDRKMAGLFGAKGHGPSHMGRSVTLEGDAKFETIGIVYYPGLDYFLSLMQSQFYTGIAGGKQLGDTLAIPTVPILDRL